VQFGAIMGTVERVDLMQTYLTMPDNRQAIVPNAKVGGDAIINYNRLGQRRFEINVDVGYDADIGQAIEIVRGLFEADARILKDPAPGVWVCALDAKAKTVELVVRAWVHVADLWEAQTAFMRAVKEKFEAEGVTAPSSQHEITVKQVISATQAELRP
jgi:small conductance mechanosensitive channel